MNTKKILMIVLTLVSGVSSAQTFTLKSSDIGGQATMKQVFNNFGCTGENISPELSWSNAPEGTKSFAVTMYDPDAPTGAGWWHWVMFDIPANVTELKTNAGNPEAGLAPKGAIMSPTSFGKPGYGGPCPPPGHGFHMYIITVYALKVPKLGLDATANPEMVGYNLWANTIEKASIIMYFKKD
jgi:Raf kinase inhibitor-like YbhB/YbcL family protein